MRPADEYATEAQTTYALEDYPPSSQQDDELIGVVLGDTYRVVRIIGEGGMARVYEARHTRIQSKRFAVKVLHPEFMRQPEVLSRFQREAEAAGSIVSPYVVDVYDVARTPDGRPYMVAQFLEGRELADYLSEVGRLGIGPAVRIVRQVVKGLESAHDRGVVHRDMKPENVFLTGDLQRPVAKVLDFGISKTGDTPGTALTKTGMIMGTPAYMSPEQARGERVDQRADIYGVGAMLYCMVTGQRPFDRPEPHATLTAVLTEDPERPRVLNPQIPDAFEMVIQRAMAKQPEDRYQSMVELDRDLSVFEVRDRAASTGPFSAIGSNIETAPEVPLEERRDAAANLDERVKQAALSRPFIVLFSVLGGFGVFAGVTTLIAAILRMLRGGVAANLTLFEAVLLMGLPLIALVAPIALAVRHVARDVWSHQSKAVALAAALRRPVVAGLVAYGFAALLVRLVETVVLRRSVGVAWPMWDLLLAALGLFAATVAGLVAKTGSNR